MKINFMNALTYELVSTENLMPVRDKNGKYALYEHRRVLQLKQRGNILIVEIQDGDVMTPEQIESHCQKNLRWIEKASHRMIPKIYNIFVFNGYPDPYKEEMLSRYESPDYRMIISDVFMNEVVCLNERAGDSVYVSACKKAFGKDPEQFEDLGMTYNVIKAYNEEILSEMLPNKMKATYILMAFTLLIYFLDYILKSVTGREIIKNFGVKQSVLITLGEYWRLFTPMFLHADFMHIASNMFSLYILGQAVEKLFGSAKFTAIYLLGGIMGNIFSYTLTRNMSLGASGAVFAIGGAVIVIWKMKASRLMRMSGKDFFLVVLIGINIMMGFGNTGIDNWAHLGGLIGGIILSFAFGYKNSILKPRQKAYAFMAYIILSGIIYMIGYNKWITLIRLYS